RSEELDGRRKPLRCEHVPRAGRTGEPHGRAVPRGDAAAGEEPRPEEERLGERLPPVPRDHPADASKAARPDGRGKRAGGDVARLAGGAGGGYREGERPMSARFLPRVAGPRMVQASGAVLLATLFTVLAAEPVDAQNGFTYLSGQSMHPAFEGWERNEDGSYNFVFGYMNRNWEETS